MQKMIIGMQIKWLRRNRDAMKTDAGITQLNLNSTLRNKTI